MNNKCLSCYERFLELASLEKPLICERHHKIPKTLGGSNSSDNIVNLSLKNHFYAHVFLTKVYDTGSEHYKMLCAITRLKGKGTRPSIFIDAEIYEQSKIERSKLMSERMKGHKLSEETKEKISKAHIGMRRSEEKRLTMRKPHNVKWRPKTSEETKQKYRNSKLNRKWVHKDNIKKHIFLEEVDAYLSNGFIIGRGLNNNKMKKRSPVSEETRQKKKACNE